MPHTSGTFVTFSIKLTCVPKGVLREESTLFLYTSLAGTGNAKTVFVPFYKILKTNDS